MKITEYKENSLVFCENGSFFEYNFKLLEKVKNYFSNERIVKIDAYKTLYEVTSKNDNVYLLTDDKKCLYIKKYGELYCTQILEDSEIFGIIQEKIVKALSELQIVEHNCVYNPENGELEEIV